MGRDYYEDAETIAKLLDQEGLPDVAAELRDVVSGGAVATEILMGLRHRCEEFLRSSRGSDTTRARVREFVAAIGEALA